MFVLCALLWNIWYKHYFMQFLEKVRRWKESINTNLPSVWVGSPHYVSFWGTKKHFRKELSFSVIEKHFRKCWARLRSFSFTGSILKENEGVLGGYRIFPFGDFTCFMYQLLDSNFVPLYKLVMCVLTSLMLQCHFVPLISKTAV